MPIDKKQFYMYKVAAVSLYAFFQMVSLTWLRAHYVLNPIVSNDPVYQKSIFVRINKRKRGKANWIAQWVCSMTFLVQLYCFVLFFLVFFPKIRSLLTHFLSFPFVASYDCV